MNNHLIVDIKRFEVIDQSKRAELEALLDEKNINSKELMLILKALKLPGETRKPCKYTKLPKKIAFIDGRTTIRIADRLINLKVRK